MNKVLVRCWKLENYRPGRSAPDELFITYPESNNGHELITCTNCGEIYAITVVKEVYVGPPLAEKIRDMKCVKCGKKLEENFSYYPENYISDGQRIAYQRSTMIPDDNQTLVKEFYGIYE